jgi:formyltetrahydrofolate deformylase
VNYILKIDCQDKKGLVYQVSQVMFEHSLNIEKNNEFVDFENQKFFYRALFSGEVDVGTLQKELTGVLPNNANIFITQKKKKNIIIMATKESHTLGDILIKNFSNELNANILAVVSNYDKLQNLVEKFDIPYFSIEADGLSREEHEQKVLDTLAKFDVDYIVLAKYMRILTAKFVSNYEGKIINIHHSFLPAFIGANPYKQAHQRGVKIIGATSHFVTNDLDEGPIIYQDIVRVNHEFSWQDMQKAGRNIEKTVLSNAIDLVFDDRVFVQGNKTIVF